MQSKPRCYSYSLAQFRIDDCLCAPKYRCYDYPRIEHEDLLYPGATLGDDTVHIFPKFSHQEVIGGPTSENRALDSEVQVQTAITHCEQFPPPSTDVIESTASMQTRTFEIARDWCGI